MGKTPEVTTALKYIKQLLFTDTLKPKVPPVMCMSHRKLFSPGESVEELRFSLYCGKVEQNDDDETDLPDLRHLS